MPIDLNKHTPDEKIEEQVLDWLSDMGIGFAEQAGAKTPQSTAKSLREEEAA